MAARAAVGRLEASAVVVDEPGEASRLHNRGGYGEPLPGGALRLHPVEAAHLIELGRLDAGAGLTELLARHEGADVAFLAYRDLRERGLLVRPSGDDWAVWRRGAGLQEPPWFRLVAVPERAPLVPGRLLAACAGEAVASVVDEDGAVTHYRIAPESPRGDAGARDLPASTGTVLRDRVLVEGTALHAAGFLGTPVGDRLVLSFTEAEHLRRRGLLDLGSGPELAAWAAEHQHHFTRTLPVYEDLRARGVLPRSGFRFGTHLRGYEGDPERHHAKWLIQCVRPDDELHWSEASRAVRLAHGVKKTFCLAVVDKAVHYVALSWFRP